MWGWKVARLLSKRGVSCAKSAGMKISKSGSQTREGRPRTHSSLLNRSISSATSLDGPFCTSGRYSGSTLPVLW